ncbi:MAG: hypothetical protein A2846_02680 [Candidatus Doudnabacteria bacterium RIFCSPHIGHO2_01_FULL_49_9]|uniref:ABC transporter domain-containing protein n=1 Tax=Candidatus Doudnabacteria bacterium RIFCSPHIGHO2_01_FULL_49_9 TaxID=1817827 RepID=A0A1F5P3P8_9BACT|nr:MAG: hypothetical protein A2846_02680 [Candidatus Doudnabacteria bacterium RIFCSPHIGHO2_01_FULL_49_9]
MRILQELNDSGHTIILVTHEMDTASHGKRLVRIKDGLIINDEKVAKRLRAADGDNLLKTK